MEKPIQVTLVYSDFGCPQFVPAEKSRLTIEVCEGGTNDRGNDVPRVVSISGNRQGLRDLATAILALAEASVPQHLHLDDLYSRNIQAPDGYWLNIENIESC